MQVVGSNLVYKIEFTYLSCDRPIIFLEFCGNNLNALRLFRKKNDITLGYPSWLNFIHICNDVVATVHQGSSRPSGWELGHDDHGIYYVISLLFLGQITETKASRLFNFNFVLHSQSLSHYQSALLSFS